MIGNILMWSHYAGQHKGFCIQYHFSDQFTNATTEKRTTRLKEIIYRNNKDALDITRSTIDTNIGLCTKHIDWQYENEVRLISYELGSSDLFCPVPLDDASYIKCIYFGYKCDEKIFGPSRKFLRISLKLNTIKWNQIIRTFLDLPLKRYCNIFLKSSQRCQRAVFPHAPLPHAPPSAPLPVAPNSESRHPDHFHTNNNLRHNACCICE